MTETLQFALERAVIVDLLGEVAGAEIRFIEKLIADSSALRHARRGKLQPAARPLLRMEPAPMCRLRPAGIQSRPRVPWQARQPASSGDRELYKGRKSRSWFQCENVTKPAITQAAAIRIEAICFHVRLSSSRFIWSSIYVLHLHAHDFLISGNHFVPYLQEQIESNSRLLRCQRNFVDLLVLSGKKLPDGGLRVLLETVRRVRLHRRAPIGSPHQSSFPSRVGQ